MKERIVLIHGYFWQEITEQEMDKYRKCLSGNSKTILVICKDNLKNSLKEINVVNDLSKKLKDELDLQKIKYLEHYTQKNDKEKNESFISVYNKTSLNEVKFIEKNSEDEYLNRGYKKIILAGYYDPIDRSFIDAIGL